MSKKLFPLSKSEEGIYISSLSLGDAYNLAHLVHLGKGWTKDDVENALKKVIQAHPYLLTQLSNDEDGRIVKSIVETPFSLPYEEVKEVKVDSLPYTLLNAPLYRFKLFKVQEELVLYFDFYHLIMDGTSIKIFIDDFFAALEGKELIKEEANGNDYSLEEEDLLSSSLYEEGKSYYDKLIGGLEIDSSLVEDKKDDVISYGSFKKTLTISNTQIKEITKKYGLKTSTYFLAAFSYLLAKYGMDSESLFLTVNNARNEKVAHSFGSYVKTYPLYVNFEQHQNVLDLLQAVNEENIENVKHNTYPLSSMVKDLGLSCDVLFAYQGDYFYKGLLKGKEIKIEQLERKDGKEKLAIELHRDGDSFFVWVEYRSDLYEESNITHFIHLFDLTLKEFLALKDLQDINLVDEEETKRLDSFHQIEKKYIGLKKTVIDDFEECVKKYPDNIAVVFKDRKYTYQEVDKITTRIANELIRLGAKKEKIVSILIHKSEFIVLASLAVLKSGAAYQPLDPTYPEDRLNFMVKDSEAIILIRDDDLSSLIHDFKGKEILSSQLLSFEDDTPMERRPSPEDLFIMLYTSGSTGLPKGVMFEHQSIYCFTRYHRDIQHIHENSHVSAYASYGFDADMMDIYPTITSGATLYVIPDEMRLNLVELGKYFEENHITHSFITTQVGRQFATEISCSSLQYFAVGGEKLVPMDPPKGYTFFNIYGPTEGTVYCTIQEVDKRYYRIPIGKALPTYKAYVLDKNKKRLPVLCNGELYISGPQVARGYLHREKENKEAFLVNTFDKEAGFERLYKTGDIVRFLEDGTIDFIGRKDGQVKIRGFRIELSEVEGVIREFPGIKDATIKDFTDPSGVKYIVAYIVSDEKIDVEKLNAFIASKKPPYMVPAYTMQIDKIPLNQNQKVNKRALPEVKIQAEEIVPPSNEEEQAVFDILKDVLGHDQFGVTSNIYHVGLTSVSSIRFTILLSKKFHKEVENDDLKKYPNIRDLVAFLCNKEEEKTYELREEYPISKTQEGVFVECAAKKDSTTYNIPFLFQLDKRIDLEKLKQALIKALDHHPYLKTILKMDENGEILATRKERESVVTILNQEIVKEHLIRPFSLLDSPLYRMEIYQGKENYLFLDFHHIICDGTSVAIFLTDVSKAYLGEELQKEEFTGFEVALKEKEDLASDKLEKAKAYYKDVLKDMDGEYALKKDLKTKKESKLASIDYVLKLDQKQVDAFVKDNKLTNNALFNFAFGFTLSKFNYRKDALYVTIYNGRKSSKLFNTTSMLVKTLPVYLSYEEDDKILNNINKMKEELSGLEEHDIYSFAEVVKDFSISADTMFAYQGDDFSFTEIGGLPVKSILLESDTTKTPFGLDIFLENGVFRAHYEYDVAIYNENTIASFNRLFELVLNESLKKNTIKEINTLPEEDIKLYQITNDTDVEIPEGVTVNQLLEKQVLAHPDKVAVIDNKSQFTYAELNTLANQVAHALIDKGVKANQTVVMLMPRVKEAYAVRQGIVKSGGAFLPIDPKYPDERISYIIEDSKTNYVITTKEVAQEKKELLKMMGKNIFLMEEMAKYEKKDNPNLKISQSDLCYVIYTSGSTGKPKGVMLSHRNLLNYVLDGKNITTAEYRHIGEDCVSCSFASFSFDASLQEEFVPLTHGYTVVIASEEEIENPMLLAQTLKKHQVVLMFMTPSFVSNLLDIPPFVEALRDFKVLDMGAEAVPIELCQKLRALGVNAQINNGYGPTETTITSTYCTVKDEYMTIGRPAGNTKVFILDKNAHILPINAIGDLTIAGESVGMGYLGNPEKTKAAFITLNGMRAYRTGDLARVNGDGNIEFFGRLDNQVKLRGLRVELGEIEKAINSYPGISTAIVIVKNSPEGDYLVAYYVASTQIDKDDLTSHISKTLTPYMIPKAMMQLEKLPLTANGKVDKKNLPEVQVSEVKKEFKAASNELEKKLLALFQKALGNTNIGVDDDFFTMGGTSLSVSKIAMLALNENLPIAYGDVFEYPTVLKLEEHINSLSGEVSTTKEDKKEDREEVKLESLKHNVVKEVDDIKMDFTFKKVLLTGATGFLGIHILNELLDQKCQVVALIRGGKISAKDRLLGLMAYYFDSPRDEDIENLVEVVDGDVTDETLYDKVKDYDFNIIINAAAIVKHFANDDIIEKVNVGGVKNLIEVAKKKNARIVQISTLSVAGENIDNKFAPTFKIREDMLDFGQDVSNKYVHSKFNAEKAILQAVDEEGVDGKIIRVGNLMSRQSDGEFQANSITNGFMRDLKGYVTLHQFPVNSMDATIDFSPIDEVAKTILLLSKTPKKFTIFHSANSHMVEMGDIVYVLNELGFDIKVVPDAVFLETMKQMMMDETKSMLVSSLISYSSSDMHTHSFIGSDNEFTNKALYHLSYKWPITDYNYLKNAIESLDTLDFFERNDL